MGTQQPDPLLHWAATCLHRSYQKLNSAFLIKQAGSYWKGSMCAFEMRVFLDINPAYLQKGIAMELPSHRVVPSLDANLLGTVKKLKLTAYEAFASHSSNEL